jgi:hypothetical protein
MIKTNIWVFFSLYLIYALLSVPLFYQPLMAGWQSFLLSLYKLLLHYQLSIAVF